MAATLTALLTAHLLGDFVMQPNWMIERKRRIHILLLHALVIVLVSYLLLGVFHWRILLAIFFTHLAMDTLKVYLLSDGLVPFLTDQLAHLGILLGLACYFPDAAADGWWIADMKSGSTGWYFATLTGISGFILCVPAGGVLIAKMIRRFSNEIRDNGIAGLTQGGQYIGWLERVLVMLLLLMNQPNGIGFLIAAKSILRFGEIKDASQRKVAEYIIIGTFVSFAWAMSISTLTQKALRYWLP
jgi:hypothetical protein